MNVNIYRYRYVVILRWALGRAHRGAAGPGGEGGAVVHHLEDLRSAFHNFKSQIFKLSISNPKNKYVAYVCLYCKYIILKTYTILLIGEQLIVMYSYNNNYNT